jgi:hypothetical protein
MNPELEQVTGQELFVTTEVHRQLGNGYLLLSAMFFYIRVFWGFFPHVIDDKIP